MKRRSRASSWSLGNGQEDADQIRPAPAARQGDRQLLVAFWTIPADFPTGSLGYKVIATWPDGKTQTWEPFTRDPTQLMVVAGEPAMKSELTSRR